MMSYFKIPYANAFILFSIASLEMTATFMVRTEGTCISFEASMITGDSSSGLVQYMILLTYLGVSCVVR
jgi:hypothetical protein